MSRPTKATINLSAIGHNYTLAKQLQPNSKAVAIIKADAYGHGAKAVASYLESQATLNVDAFGVACIEEAVELREGGIKKPILLLEGFFSADELDYISENNLWTAVHCRQQIEQIAQSQPKQPIHVWLKLDSGMHRLGFEPSAYQAAFEQLAALPQVASVNCMSHFAHADDLDAPQNSQQLATFLEATAGLPQGTQFSIANSAATLGHMAARQHWQRPGIMLYGATPFNHTHNNGDQLQVAMSLTSAVIALHTLEAGESVGYSGTWTAKRNSTIATVAIGYADGYPRHLPSGAPVLVNGQIAPLAGRVSMDMITVDVTGLSGVSMGSPVELWGSNIHANQIAQQADTIAYTLFTGLGKRVPRQYISL
ncbi:MAG: alanine racemase [Pontibacterium sp.]